MAQVASRVTHRGGPGSRPGQYMWDFWCTEWHWDRYFVRVLRVFPVNVIPPWLSILMYHVWVKCRSIGGRS
jgi:hypothetical protein